MLNAKVFPRKLIKAMFQAYLNGDGPGKGEYLSIKFILMRGEYDALLSFPFKQKVKLSLICPANKALSKSESFVVR